MWQQKQPVYGGRVDTGAGVGAEPGSEGLYHRTCGSGFDAGVDAHEDAEPPHTAPMLREPIQKRTLVLYPLLLIALLAFAAQVVGLYWVFFVSGYVPIPEFVRVLFSLARRLAAALLYGCFAAVTSLPGAVARAFLRGVGLM
jgi:hypothetical protein